MKTIFLTIIAVVGLVVLGGIGYLAFHRADVAQTDFEQEITPAANGAAPVTQTAQPVDAQPAAPMPAQDSAPVDTPEDATPAATTDAADTTTNEDATPTTGAIVSEPAAEPQPEAADDAVTATPTDSDSVPLPEAQ